MAKTTLRVFEHESVRVGEPRRTVEGGEVALTEREFEALVKFNDSCKVRFFEVGHKRVRFLHYVGFVQVGSLGIEVLPKADRSAASRDEAARWHGALLKMLEVAGEMRLVSPSAASQRTSKASLLEIIATRFVEATERLVHEGLTKGYRDEEENGPLFRGKLVVADHLRENAARADRFYVRHPVYDRNMILNRIVASALDVLARLPLPAQIVTRSVRCRSAFPEVTPVKVTAGLFERLPQSRAAARYRDALTLARLILEQYAPDLLSGKAPVFALFFDMNLLWERFIAAMFRRAAPAGIHVKTQEGAAFWKPAGSAARRVRPDIVVRGEGREVLLIADTKWKVSPGGAPADDELKQMFVYNQLFDSKRALLLYPSEGVAAPEWAGDYAGHAHSCGAQRLGLFEKGSFSKDATRDQIRALLASLPRS